jgi:DNA adenine methylase
MTKSLLKYPGGKREQATRIVELLGADTSRPYVEPFLGGASVFLAMHDAGTLGPGARLSDVDVHLISFYAFVRDQPDALLITILARPWGKGWEDSYYAIRDEFNRDDSKGLIHAARLFWLNKHCYNGLYRRNRAGRFNVPCGRYATPPAPPTEEHMHAVSAALQGALLWSGDFLDALALAPTTSPRRVYADPPYAPDREGGFTSYCGRFGPEEQAFLCHRLGRLIRRGSRVVASNHDVPEIRKLYEAEGFTIETVSARRSISRTGDRAPAHEILCYGGPL